MVHDLAIPANQYATSHFDANHQDEKAIFDYLLRPDDSYTSEGVYWADLSIRERISFVTTYDAAEVRREFSIVKSMFMRNPLGPISAYFGNMVLPGAGLGLEGYVLFSIGNIKPLFQAAFKTCWKTGAVCNENWIAAVEFLEIMGIMVGQVLVGVLGDWLGRRWGLIQDAGLMLLGLIMLTASWGVTLNGWVICYAWCLFIYGVGVGGEYPMTATASMENGAGSGKVSTKEDRLHRGRKVTSAFLMQGWGQFFNVIILMALLAIFTKGKGDGPYSERTVQLTYRISFAIPALGTAWLVWQRITKTRNSDKVLREQKAKSNVTGYDKESLKLTFKHFGPRIIATAGAWFANDVFFYGNKLFQSQFIAVLQPGNSSVMVGWKYNLINVSVSLAGYYLASFFIDNKLYGRKWMQIVGFMADFILFIIPAFNYTYFSSTQGIHAFQAMYFLSSFFNQFGPNSVTFLVAAEVYPTAVRATAHGFSAAVGKLGALTAAVLYGYIDTPTKFLVVPWFGLAGALLTWLLLPDTTGLDLKEQERRWEYLRQGRDSDYHGVAVHPKHLSVWENWTGVGKHYNAKLDYERKIEEMRGEWEEKMETRLKDEMKVGDLDMQVGGEAWSGEIHSYFHRTRSEKGLKKPEVTVQVGSVNSGSGSE